MINSSRALVPDLPRAAAASREAQPSVDEIQTALAQALDLKAWWARVEAGQEKIERFALYAATPGAAPVWGFFGEARVQGKVLPVMGDVVDDFFDQPRVAPAAQQQAARWMVEQIEEFALRYWLRAEASALPEPYPELDHGDPAPFLKAFSLCFSTDQDFSGSGNLQRYYKLRAGGRVGQFPPRERAAIIDLRELETTYDWITLNSRLFDFNITLGGVGDDAPSVVVPLRTIAHTVTSAALGENRHAPEPGTLAVFGPGFGLIGVDRPGVFAVAPGMIQPGLRLQLLRVLATGEVRFRGVMIMPRPEQIVNFSVLAPDLFLAAADMMTLGAARRWTQPLKQALDSVPLPDVGFDPLLGSIQLLNLLTGGRAASELCISKEQLEKEILAKDATGMRQITVAARQNWLQVPNWLDSKAIPPFIARGEAS